RPRRRTEPGTPSRPSAPGGSRNRTRSTAGRSRSVRRSSTRYDGPPARARRSTAAALPSAPTTALHEQRPAGPAAHRARRQRPPATGAESIAAGRRRGADRRPRPLQSFLAEGDQPPRLRLEPFAGLARDPARELEDLLELGDVAPLFGLLGRPEQEHQRLRRHAARAELLADRVQVLAHPRRSCTKPRPALSIAASAGRPRRARRAVRAGAKARVPRAEECGRRGGGRSRTAASRSAAEAHVLAELAREGSVSIASLHRAYA